MNHRFAVRATKTLTLGLLPSAKYFFRSASLLVATALLRSFRRADLCLPLTRALLPLLLPLALLLMGSL